MELPNENNNIFSFLLEPSEEKTPNATPIDNVNESDFTPFIEENEEITDEGEDASVIEAISKEDLNDTTEFIVDTFDLGMTMIFPALYKKMLFTKEERKVFTSISDIVKQKRSIEINQENEAIVLRYQDYASMVDDIPLDDDEKNRIKKPLKKCLEKWGSVTKISPEWSLIIVVAMILISRVYPAFTNRVK